jgi:CCR4-NOT transcription complex subunit 1
VQLLVELSEHGESYEAVHELFQFPIKSCPEILVVALAQIRPKQGGAILDDLYSELLPNYFSNHANSIPIIESIWKHNEDLFISAVCELCKKDSKKENTTLNFSRVLDITQSINNSLIALAYANDHAFSVALGIIAGKREFLNFDPWLQERIR